MYLNTMEKQVIFSRDLGMNMHFLRSIVMLILES